MPTLEFHGYSSEEAAAMRGNARERLAVLAFREEIVFVDSGPSRVEGWDGAERPFVRVLTRKQERADLIRQQLHPLCDLEVVLIDFIPKAGT